MNISVLIPGIRPELWLKVYNSIAASFSGTWEVIFVGPNFPDNLSGAPNVKFICSMASPIICRQMALIEAKGDWICYAADDVTFIPGSLDRSFSIVTQQNFDYKTVVVGKYLEGISDTVKDNPLMRGEEYWKLWYHGGLHSILRSFMKDYYLINTGLISRQMMLEIGGFDCRFEACAMACVDLSLRLQIYGVNCILQDIPIFESTHLPGHAGDHAPIHDGQTQHDEPLFFQIWGALNAITRTKIDLDFWKTCPMHWERRFGAAV